MTSLMLWMENKQQELKDLLLDDRLREQFINSKQMRLAYFNELLEDIQNIEEYEAS